MALLVSLVLVAGSTGFAPLLAQDGHHSQVDLAEDIVKANADHPKGSLGDRGFKLRLFPQQPKVAVGGKVVVSAWVCPGWDKTPFGGPKGDGKPGGDDTCKPIKAEWSVEGPATLANHKALKTRLVLNADGAVRLTAEVDDLKQSTKITVKETAAKNRGSDAAAIVKKAAQKEAKAAKVKAQKAAARQAAAEQAAKAAAAAAKAASTAEAAAAAAAPAADEPLPKEPAAEEPVETAPEASATEEPSTDPAAETPRAEESETEGPTAEPSEEPLAEETTTAEPATEEPGDEGLAAVAPGTEVPAVPDEPKPTASAAVTETVEPEAASAGPDTPEASVEPEVASAAPDEPEPTIESGTVEPEDDPSEEPDVVETVTTTPEAQPAPTPEPGTPQPSGEPTPEPQSTPSTADLGPTDEYIVTFKSGTGNAKRAGAITTAGAGNDKAIGRLDMQVVDVPRKDRAKVIDRLKADPAVRSVDRNYARTVNAASNDPLYENQWHLPHIGWEALHGVKTFSSSATVAIIDTGVDTALEDLAGKAIGTSSDPHGHGTWMATIMAANTNNARDIAGVAWTNVSVLPITAIGADGVGYDADIIAAIGTAMAANVDVILMAFSGPNRSTALKDQIDLAMAAGIVVVASVGNEGVTTPTYPAAYPGVIGVAATRKDDVVALWSDDGPSAYIAAPGVDITALNPGGTNRTIRGTSAAAAQVAGAAALLIADGITSNNVAGRLSTSAAATNMAIGRLDLAAAFGVADVEDTPPGDDTGPDGDGYIVEPEPTPTPTPEPPPWSTPDGILGLDVSHWNGLPDFKALRAQDQRFVFSKATQGTSFVDNTFQQHTSDARAAGLLAGAYHFFDYRVDGTKQAQHFLSIVRKTSGLNRLLPLVVDVETLTSLGTPNKAQAKARLHAMLDELYRQTGRYPMIYTSRYMWEKVVGAPGGFGTYPLWVACWECDTMILPNGWSDWTFWQWGLARFDGGVKLDGNVYSAGLGQLNLELSRQMKLKKGAAWTGIEDRAGRPARIRRGPGALRRRQGQVHQVDALQEAVQRQARPAPGQLRRAHAAARSEQGQVADPARRHQARQDEAEADPPAPQHPPGRPRGRVRQARADQGHDQRQGRALRAEERGGPSHLWPQGHGHQDRQGSSRDRRRPRGPSGLLGPRPREGPSPETTSRKSISPKLRTIDLPSQLEEREAPRFVEGDEEQGRARKDASHGRPRRGAQAKVSFKGQQFAVVVRRGPTGGRVKVIVDGKHVDTIDLYASRAR